MFRAARALALLPLSLGSLGAAAIASAPVTAGSPTPASSATPAAVAAPPAPAPIASPASSPADAATASASTSEAAVTARAREWLERIQQHRIDRSQLDARMNAALTDETAETVSRQTAALGPLESIVFAGRRTQQGIDIYAFTCTFHLTTATETFAVDPDGKIAGILIAPEPK